MTKAHTTYLITLTDDRDGSTLATWTFGAYEEAARFYDTLNAGRLKDWMRVDLIDSSSSVETHEQQTVAGGVTYRPAASLVDPRHLTTGGTKSLLID